MSKQSQVILISWITLFQRPVPGFSAMDNLALTEQDQLKQFLSDDLSYFRSNVIPFGATSQTTSSECKCKQSSWIIEYFLRTTFMLLIFYALSCRIIKPGMVINFAPKNTLARNTQRSLSTHQMSVHLTDTLSSPDLVNAQNRTLSTLKILGWSST